MYLPRLFIGLKMILISGDYSAFLVVGVTKKLFDIALPGAICFNKKTGIAFCDRVVLLSYLRTLSGRRPKELIQRVKKLNRPFICLKCQDVQADDAYNRVEDEG